MVDHCEKDILLTEQMYSIFSQLTTKVLSV